MLTRYIVFNDVHVPFHDTKALSLIYDIIEDIPLDGIIINGDFLDAFNLNSHQPKDPEVITSLEEEFFEARELLEELRKRNPKKKIVYLAGNHLFRLDRFVMKHCPSFYNILTSEKMLQLERLDIEFYPYNTAYQLEKTRLYIQHSPPSYGENGARTSLLKKPNGSFIYGCTHRMQHSSITDINGVVNSVWFNGWLGSVDETPEHVRVFSYAKGHSNWQKCFSLVTVVNGKEFHVQQIPIVNNSCVVDGAYYEY